MGIFGAKLVRPIGIRIREVSTRKVQHPWKKVGEKDGGRLGPNPARRPRSQSQSDVDSDHLSGNAMGRLVCAVAASYTITPGGWVGCMGEGR